MPRAESTAPRRAHLGYLPTETDSFVGRRRELTEIRQLFAKSSLVTLVGPGGVGKTRLVLRAASGMRRTFPEGVCFVDLAGIREAALLISTIGEALGMHEQSIKVTVQSLIDYLSGRRALIVLDNCEHLLEDVPRLADALLRTCPDLRLLATSREPLGIRGEALLRVQPLRAPNPKLKASPGALARYESVQLFAERAKNALPAFELNESNSGDVGAICSRLDGVPLAIELAAARLSTLTPRELARRLEDRFQLLTRGSTVNPARHQTLRHCVDWSYDQCSPAERVLWSRLSVFDDAFELDAAEGICAFGELHQAQLLDVLASLVDKSIVNREGDSDSAQFRLLDTLREYGRERLDKPALYDLRRRHRDWYEHMVLQMDDEVISPRQTAWTERLDRELPNLRAALDFSVSEPGEAGSALLIAASLRLHWITRGLLSEGRYWLDRALANDKVAMSNARVEALYTAVLLAVIQGDTEAAQSADSRCHQAVRALGDAADEVYASSSSGLLALHTGDFPGAISHLEKAVQEYRLRGDLRREVERLIALSLANGLLGESTQAVACHERILAITQPRGELWYQAFSLWALGTSLRREGDFERAGRMLEQSLRLRRQMNDLLGSVWCLEGLALVAAGEERWERAAVLLGASTALSDQIGSPAATFPDVGDAYADCESRVRRKLGDSAFRKAFAAGGRLDVGDAVAYALGEAKTTPKRTDRNWSVLTPRERQVADLVAHGLTNKAIADQLTISQRTAEAHVEHIMTKLACTSRTQIAAWIADQ